MSETDPATSVASPPDPPQDQPSRAPTPNASFVLHVIGVLLTYGRHLVDTIHQRATAVPDFNAIAACFGTQNLSTILAHLNRGILRAKALERVLLARAAAGTDIQIALRHTTYDPLEELASAEAAQKTAPQPEPPAQPAAMPAPTPRRARQSRPAGWDDPEFHMPTLEELERQVRRSKIGDTVLKICLDLAVVPGFCHAAFWNELSDAITYFGSSVAPVMQEKTRRREAFAKEMDRVRDSNWDWGTLTREAGRRILGFFIGEPPVNPLDPAAALATAPP
jgi:hypothetical protein